MRDSRRRLFTIAMVYGLGVSVIGSHVVYTMVGQHEMWERRSYSNRWAFRDVPTRRGGLRDRHGEVLRVDAPTTALEFYYRRFRRQHPCATAVHGANLAIQSTGGATRFAMRPGDFAAAFDVVVALPLEFLRSRDDRKHTRDLRFYLSSFLTALTASRPGRVSAAVGRLLATGKTGIVIEHLGLDKQALQREFEERARMLSELARVLESRPKPVKLFEVLQARETWRLKKPSSEYVPRLICRALSYDEARRFAVQRELFPGFRVRPAVHRQEAETGARWESVERLLGSVTGDWGAEDEARRKEILARMAPELERMAEANADVPEELQAAVTRRLQSTLANHLANEGRVGRSGVEKDLDGLLRGQAGVQWLAKARQRRDVGLWSTFNVTPGADVTLTIDLRLQHRLELSVDAALADRPPEQCAAIAIVDPSTGDILALVSRPNKAHDKKGAAGPGSAVRWTGNGAIGSLAKPLLLAEHLDAIRRGRPARHHSTFAVCAGDEPLSPREPGIKYRRHRLRCDKVHGHEALECVPSLGKSCNYFFYQLGEGLEAAGVRAAYDRFGLYQARRVKRTLPASAPGEEPKVRWSWPAPSPRAQPSILGLPAQPYPLWHVSHDIQRRSIGYFIDANVLHLARAYCGLATGRLPQLSLVLRESSELEFLDVGLHPDDLRIVRDGMKYCSEEGTAKDLQMENVWAKTGTAEVGKKVNGKSNNNAWLAGFVGLAPSRLVFVSVVYNVEHGAYGAAIAGPMFTTFLKELRANPELAKEYLGR